MNTLCITAQAKPSRLRILLALMALSLAALVTRAQGSVVYYGMHGASMAPVQAGQSNTIAITGITDGTSYTVRDLDTATNIASGTVNRGSQSWAANLVNNHHFKVTASRPVQAQIYYEFDNTANYYGDTFFMSDNGVTEIGRSFIMPVPLLTGSPIEYWIFANGAGTVTVNTLAGATIAANTFAALGAWQIPSAVIASNTVYAVSSANVDFALQQSSQNVSTEVPPSGQVAAPGSCTIPGTGTSFMVHSQPYNGNNMRIAVFPYSSGTYTVTRLNGCNGGGNIITNRAITAGTLDYRSLGATACPFQITATVPIGVQVGSTEGATTSVWDMGDDSGFLRGTGNQIRGHALRCGGVIIAGQDGTTINGTGITTTPALPQTLNADGFIAVTGNFANNTLFNVTSQDASHPMVIQVFGGNCDTQLNDWQKTMRPAALTQPFITNPANGVFLNSATPTVTGTGIPGATVTLTVRSAAQVVEFTGTATVDAAGNWAIPVSTALTQGVHYFKATQGFGGVCAVNPNPPGNGNQGTIDTIPPAAPAVTSPANNSSSTMSQPVISGTAEANSTVKIYIDGVLVGTVSADALGAWNYSLTAGQALAAGTHAVYATATDIANNLSAPSTTNNFNVVFAAPAVNSPINAGATSLSGASSAANGTGITVYKNGAPVVCTPAATVSGGTWSCGGVSGLAGGESITATAGSGAATSAISSAVIVTPAAPTISGPIVTGTGVTVNGSSTAPNGSSLTVLVNGAPVSCAPAATVSGGSWSCGGLTLNPGDVVTSRVTANGQTSAASAAQTILFAAPAVSGPINAGAGTISGTSSAANGTTLNVYNNGVFMGATTVSGGAWTLAGVSGLIGGESITAVAGTGAAASAISSAVIVTPAVPVVTGPLVAGQTSISGTSTAPAGSTITVNIGGTNYPTTVLAGGTWTVTAPALVAGAVVTSTATAGGQTSAASSGQTVINQSPVVSGPIYPSDTAIGGTSTASVGSVISVYQNGVLLGTTTVLAGGGWSLSGVSGLIGGAAITATAGSGPATSLYSPSVIVASLPGLLRTVQGSLSPTTASFPRAPGDPSLARANLVVTLFNPGASYPQEFTDYSDTTTPVVFFQMEANSGNTLRVTKDKLNGKLVISY